MCRQLPPESCYRLLQARVARDSSYTEVMAISRIDRPEPRGPVILALVAVTVIYMALPKELIIRPTWLLPVLVVMHFVYYQSGDPENSEAARVFSRVEGGQPRLVLSGADL
jgi:hypothetical protein